MANYLRALRNGVPISRRTATTPNYVHRNCFFNCGEKAQDSLDHYCRRPILNAAVRGIHENASSRLRPYSRDAFFGMVKGMSFDDKILCARSVYVKLRMIHLAQRNGSSHD